MLLLIAAAQLSVTDLRDLRCVYVFQTAANAARDEKGSGYSGTAEWFSGRLSASQPKLNVFRYLQDHFYKPKVATTRADLEACAEVIGKWEADQVGPLR